MPKTRVNVNADTINATVVRFLKNVPSRIGFLAAKLSSASHETLTDGKLAREADVLLQEVEAVIGHFRSTMKAHITRKQIHAPDEGPGGLLRMILAQQAGDEDCDDPDCPRHGAQVRARRAAAHKN